MVTARLLWPGTIWGDRLVDLRAPRSGHADTILGQCSSPGAT